jgi:phosphohistidine swiveling domain-containing protein
MTTTPDRWFISRIRFIPAIWPIDTYFSWDVAGFMNVESMGIGLHVFDKGQCTAIWEADRLKELSQKMIERLAPQMDRLDDIRKKGLETGVSIVSLCKAFGDKAETASLDEYLAFFEEFTARYQEFMKDNMLYWFFASQILETKIRSALKEHSQEIQNEILGVMSKTESSYSNLEEKEFHKLVLFAKDNGIDSGTTEAMIKDFSKKYFWFPYEYVGPNIWDEKAVRERVAAHLSDAEKAHEEIAVENVQKALISRYKISKDLLEDFTLMRAMTLMQDDRKMINAQVCYYVNGVILKALADKLGVTLEEARYIDRPILRKLMEGDKDSLKLLKDRTVFYVSEYQDGKIIAHDGEDAKKRLLELGISLFADHSAVTEIKGSVANRGKVTGQVRVLRISQVTDLKDGSVIVTGMTTPDFVPLMKKAIAIVTDEGGITSHAAIVSRELNIPCIIGTKIATKVLKDGMMVEVDAEKGIVKILK